MLGNRIPLCKICKRTVYYGSDTCGKKDCNERFTGYKYYHPYL